MKRIRSIVTDNGHHRVRITLEVTGKVLKAGKNSPFDYGRPEFIARVDQIESGLMDALGQQGFLLNKIKCGR